MSRAQRKLNRRKPLPCSTRPKEKMRRREIYFEEIKAAFEKYCNGIEEKLNKGARTNG